MYHLKLVKGLSYTGVVEATKQHPDVFVEDKATADAAVASGYFAIVKDGEDKMPGSEDGSQEGEKEVQGKALEKMTASELETFAAYKGVSLKGLTKKADMIAKLKEELGEEETDGEVDYGSPTMQELMEQ